MRSAFGWQTQVLGEDMGHYVLATTTATNEQGPKTPGAIHGGFFRTSPMGRRNIHAWSLRWTISQTP